FGEGHGLFDKYMLPRLQCRQSLRGVMLIPAYDHDDVHRRIIENLVVVRSAILRAKSNRVAFGAGAAARLNGAEPHTWNLLQIRQMDPASQISSAHQRNPEVRTAALDWVYRDSRCRLGLSRILSRRVFQKDRETVLSRVHDDVIGFGRFLQRKVMGDEIVD